MRTARDQYGILRDARTAEYGRSAEPGKKRATQADDPDHNRCASRNVRFRRPTSNLAAGVRRPDDQMNGDEHGNTGNEQLNQGVEPRPVKEPYHAGDTEQEPETQTRQPDKASQPQGAQATGGVRSVADYFRDWRTWGRDDVEVLFSGVVACAAIVGGVGLIITWILTRASLEETRQANVTAARAASAAERAISQGEGLARMSMDHAERLASDALRLERRAWIGMTGISNANVAVGKPLAVRIPLENSGHTPAHVDSIEVQMRALAATEPFTPTYDADTGPASRSVVHPGMRGFGVTLIPGGPLTPGDMVNIKKGSMRTYVFGEIIYRDIFHASHRSTFCQWLDTDLTFKWCDTYNEAD